MPYWKNPFTAGVRPVTLASAIKTLDKFFFEPQPYSRRAQDALDEHGNLIDAYCYRVQNAGDISLAFRYGPADEQYISYILPPEAAQELEDDDTMPHWQASKDANADPSDGFIFRWWSKALQNYAPGQVYVVGGDVNEARKLAAEEFERWLSVNRAYLDPPELDELRKQFAEDLAYPPKCATVWLKTGSE